MTAAKVWLYASRPKTLWISVCPVILGTTFALKEGFHSIVYFTLTLLSALLIQVGTNLSNDYFDFKKGGDTKNRKGLPKVIQLGVISPESIKKGFITVFCCAFITSLALLARGGVVIAVVFALSVFFAITYTATRFSLAYLGLADIVCFIFFGPVATTFTYYLQTLRFSMPLLCISLAPGMFSLLPLLINNIRDVDEDTLSNKKTLPVRFGVNFAKCLFLLATAVITIIPIVKVAVFKSHPLTLLTLITLIPISGIIKTLFSYKDARELNPALAKSTITYLAYTFIISATHFL